jgi:hypothetical protein
VSVRRRRWIGPAVLSGALAGIAAPAPLRADEPWPASETVYQDRMAAAARLVEEENHAAAQAEYEAAYRASPHAAALAGVGQCERARFRYPQAIAALERALAERAAPLNDAERRLAELSIAELRALLGEVVVKLSPAGAVLRIDGEDQPPAAALAPIPLGPGSHRLEARLPGLVPAAQTITLASGDRVTVTLALAPPGAPREAGPRRGLYALGAVSVFVPVGPTDFTGTSVGGSGGVRLGYRAAAVVGVEALFEYAHAGASGHGTPSFATSPSASYALGYSLSSARFGLNVRLMTTGERFRFVQLFGGGAALDSISWPEAPGVQRLGRRGAAGADGFALSETGFEVDLGGALLGLTLQNYLGSRGALDEPTHDQWSANTYGGPLYSLGLGLRGGYRLW